VRVLFVVEQYGSEGSRYYREFFGQLKDRGVGSVVVNLSGSDDFRHDIEDLVEGHYPLNLTRGYHRSIGLLRKIFRAEAPSVVQGMEIIPSFYSALALATLPRRRPPLLYGRRHGTTEGPVPRLMDWVAFAASERVVAVSEATAEVARKEHPLGRRKVCFIWSGVSLGERDQGTEERPSLLATLRGGQDYTVLLLARLRPEKGHLVAIQAAEILREHGIGFRFLFVGEGPERGRLEREVKDRDLSPEITFTGHLDDIRLVFEVSDVMIIPSFADAFPKVAVEAFAAEVPVVASAVGGLEELISSGKTGLLVDSGDPRALAEALASLWRNPDRARLFASNAREVYENELTPEVMAERYLSEYLRVVKKT
jgi:glycosyltransferase involved in cell wall biosynthesis